MARMRTIKQAAAETGLSYSCIRRWCLSSAFAGWVKTGNKFLINMDMLNDFLTGKGEKNDA